jgi:hypothetical protein
VIATVGAHATHVVWILGVFIVIGCLIAAGFAAYRRDLVAAVVLCLVALVAGVLLL